MEQWRITNMFTVPTIVKLLTEHRLRGRAVRSFLAALRDLCRRTDVSGGSEIRPAALGPVLVQYFGLGEVTGNITVLPPALHDASGRWTRMARIGTCGFERTGMQVSIQDDERA